VIVAIDGPAGAGKSTVARQLADRLGFRYLDTGAMYRALTWLALRRGVALDDGPAVAELAGAHPVEFDGNGVAVAGHDVTREIRAPEIDRVVSHVARHPEVRRILRARQRELARRGNAVVEGRDIGTVVAPDAGVKVYLVADPKIRARRRVADRPGIGADALATDLRLRDERDAAQMEAAADAVRIDTSALTVEAVVARIEELVRERAAAAGESGREVGAR
jgi:cytidylate kinase